MSTSIAIAALQAHFNPFEHEVWGIPVLEADVQTALEQGRLAEQPGGADHAARIAYLVQNPNAEPIAIDVGCPSFGCCVAWPIMDGNHRLAAAIFRQDETILAEVSGEVACAKHLFGAHCVI